MTANESKQAAKVSVAHTVTADRQYPAEGPVGRSLFYGYGEAPSGLEASDGLEPSDGMSRSRRTTRGKPRKRRDLRTRRVSYSIPTAQVKNLEEAWWYARAIGRPMNRFVTIRPANIDDMAPEDRVDLWYGIRNRLAQYARDHGFELYAVWSLETKDRAGAGEHIHVLLHVPGGERTKFDAVVQGWYSDPEEVKVKPADYGVRITDRGKSKSVGGYVLKNSPQAAFGTSRLYKIGGPIFGKRAGCTRNLDAKARAANPPKQPMAANSNFPAHKRAL